MSQALRDLPDPLLPPPALPSSSPDDLLAKMADEAIDQLMAAADTGHTPTPLPPLIHDDSAGAVVDDEIEADEPPDFHKAPQPVAAAMPVAGAAGAVVEPPPAAQVGIASADDSTALNELPAGPPETAAVSPATAAATPVEPPPPAADMKALLAESTPPPASPLLWPLRLINAPFAFLGDNARTFVGLLGVVTLVPAIAAIVYVLYLKH